MRLPLLSATVAVALIACASAAPNGCSKEHTAALWDVLLSKVEKLNEEARWCVHAGMHPALPKWRCAKRRKYTRAVNKAVRKCRKTRSPVPHAIAAQVIHWARTMRQLGVREEVVCCVHSKVHNIYARGGKRRRYGALKYKYYPYFGLLPDKLMAWQRKCTMSIVGTYGYAY